jgi:hypothetical protein
MTDYTPTGLYAEHLDSIAYQLAIIGERTGDFSVSTVGYTNSIRIIRENTDDEFINNVLPGYIQQALEIVNSMMKQGRGRR